MGGLGVPSMTGNPAWVSEKLPVWAWVLAVLQRSESFFRARRKETGNSVREKGDYRWCRSWCTGNGVGDSKDGQ
jgi:hypothetical protein